MTDQIIHGMLCDQQIRFAAISGKTLVSDARATHTLSRVATAALGRQLLITSMVSSWLKNETDTVTTILSGGGAGGNLVCVGRFGGLVKGYAAEPAVELPLRADGKLDVAGYVGISGKLTLIRDLGLKEPYVGMCNLRSGEIAEDFAQYFTASEQQPSIVYLGVRENAADGAVLGAGGLLIQTMPDCSDDAIEQVMQESPRFAALSERLAAGEPLAAILSDLFQTLSPTFSEEVTPLYRCDCTRERLERALLSVGEHDLRELLEQDGEAELTCQFCQKNYHFDAEDLAILLREAPDQGGSHAG